MTRRNFAILGSAILAVGATGYGWQRVHAQADGASVPYQGQNVGRYQMFYSPLARADTFLVDTAGGNVWVETVDKDGNNQFSTVSVLPSPKVTGSKVGRFAIYFSPNVRADTFLMDTETGMPYQLVKTKDGSSAFEIRLVLSGQ